MTLTGLIGRLVMVSKDLECREKRIEAMVVGGYVTPSGIPMLVVKLNDFDRNKLWARSLQDVELVE